MLEAPVDKLDVMISTGLIEQVEELKCRIGELAPIVRTKKEETRTMNVELRLDSNELKHHITQQLNQRSEFQTSNKEAADIVAEKRAEYDRALNKQKGDLSTWKEKQKSTTLKRDELKNQLVLIDEQIKTTKSTLTDNSFDKFSEGIAKIEEAVNDEFFRVVGTLLHISYKL